MHIAPHYGGNYEFSLPLSKESVQLDTRIDPVANQVAVQVDTGGADASDADLGVQLAVLPAGGSFPKDALRAKFDGGRAAVILPLPGRQPGTYRVVARLSRMASPCWKPPGTSSSQKCPG